MTKPKFQYGLFYYAMIIVVSIAIMGCPTPWLPITNPSDGVSREKIETLPYIAGNPNGLIGKIKRLDPYRFVVIALDNDLECCDHNKFALYCYTNNLEFLWKEKIPISDSGRILRLVQLKTDIGIIIEKINRDIHEIFIYTFDKSNGGFLNRKSIRKSYKYIQKIIEHIDGNVDTLYSDAPPNIYFSQDSSHFMIIDNKTTIRNQYLLNNSNIVQSIQVFNNAMEEISKYTMLTDETNKIQEYNKLKILNNGQLIQIYMPSTLDRIIISRYSLNGKIDNRMRYSFSGVIVDTGIDRRVSPKIVFYEHSKDLIYMATYSYGRGGVVLTAIDFAKSIISGTIYHFSKDVAHLVYNGLSGDFVPRIIKPLNDTTMLIGIEQIFTHIYYTSIGGGNSSSYSGQRIFYEPHVIVDRYAGAKQLILFGVGLRQDLRWQTMIKKEQLQIYTTSAPECTTFQCQTTDSSIDIIYHEHEDRAIVYCSIHPYTGKLLDMRRLLHYGGGGMMYPNHSFWIGRKMNLFFIKAGAFTYPGVEMQYLDIGSREKNIDKYIIQH